MNRVYFTDRDLGKQFPEILRTSGLDVRSHDECFTHDCPDEEWLRVVGEQGWIAITHDRRIRYKTNELAAVMRHRVALLVVIGKARHSELAYSFVASKERIEEFLESHIPPFIAKVYRPSSSGSHGTTPGRVLLWLPKESK